ncbi:MOSC domain-containing protein [Conexibacter sp. W3-3-2]|uniref:MOSC domain-containing protein n=1 Tax=Conexibacter sp. W3-3-2 TaxID=2675227 RepID=UPI001321F364|nr:MOSC domain-containing protein [Conexibacter sp. W3-3-2]MTD42808.1 MOSC domain-containing protein [Conexibacter sp. W3-3-2]
MSGTVLSVNVGRAREHGSSRGRPVRSAIRKAPQAGRVALHGEALAGDEQVERRYHGGPDQAVYAYASEDLAWWATELGLDAIAPGTIGENLTTRDVDPNGAVIGERWRVGPVLLAVTAPRIPCAKLGRVFPGTGIVRRFAHAGRTGAYLRLLEPGDVGAGDAVTVVDRPAHGVTVADVARIVQHERHRAAELRAVPELASRLAAWAADAD